MHLSLESRLPEVFCSLWSFSGWQGKEEWEFPGVALCPTISSRKNNPFLSKMQPLKSFELFEFNLRVQEAKNNTDFFSA